MSVTVAAGETSSCFTGDITDDQIGLEFSENFFLDITSTSPADGLTIAQGSTEVSIIDDDCK